MTYLPYILMSPLTILLIIVFIADKDFREQALFVMISMAFGIGLLLLIFRFI